jgi:tetratricopeptide (TPR) repeat protein
VRLVPGVTVTVADLLRAGLANHRAGRAALAEELYRRVLSFDPRQPDALHLLGVLELDRGRAEAALALIDQAVGAAPGRGDLHLSRAGALARLSRSAEAADAFAAASRLEPGITAAHAGLGHALAETGGGDPQPPYHRALALDPAAADVWNGLGVAIQRAATLAAGQPAFDRAVALRPGDALLLRNLAGGLVARNRGPAGLRRYRQAIALQPDDGIAHDGIGALFSAWGELEGARRAFDRAHWLEDPPGEAWSNRLFFLNFLPGFGFAEHYRENRRWAKRIEAGAADAPTFANERSPERRLRLAYVSPELVAGHNQLAWLMPLLEHHDRSRFEVVVYADVARPDAGTERVAGRADRFASIHGLSRPEQAARIRADRIDIAVNLCGWRAAERALFAHRPAPIQVAYDNHVTTTGLRAVDVRITDEVVDPLGVADPHYTERLVRLATGYASHHPPSEAPEVSPLPAHRNGQLTFGSVNQVPKLSPPTIALWARLLERVSGSRLLLKAYNLGDPAVVDVVRRRFVAAGVASSRLIFVGALTDPAEHFRAIGEIDVALDPFPFNGGKSTCDALWMGVPVVTLAGASLMGRIGASLLTRAGLPELVASDEDAYLRIVEKLASDLDRLAALRRGLRAQLAASVLFDGAGHARDLEDAYRRLWREWCARS